MVLRIELQPKQSEFERTVEEKPIALFGGAKGGGKSRGLRDIMLARRFRYPGSKGAIFRESYPELEKNHIRPLFECYPQLERYYNRGHKILTLPNKSTLEFGYIAKFSDLTKHQGAEYHDLAIEEAGNWPEQWFRTLSGCNRTSIPGIKPRILLTANPGGVGHAWLKRLFVSKRYNERENPNDYAFVKALVTDNFALMNNDPKYIERLEAEPNEMLRRAFRWGDWDIAAGQFFAEFDRDIHVLPKDFTVPAHWRRFHCYDYGFGHPACFLWLATDEDGNIYVYREFVQAHLRVDQQAALINPGKKQINAVAGLDCWNRRGQKGPTIAEEFQEHGIILSRANTDRIQGAAQIRKRLAITKLPNGNRLGPKLFITENCPITIDCLTRMVHDPADVEDVLKVDSTDGDVWSGDDPYDTLRYGLMSRPIASAAPKPEIKDRYLYRRPKSTPWTAA